MVAKTGLTYYRPDIDGLRAIAVLAVIFFHANVFGFEGGFVGVDMFFVISGYLITGIILRDYHEGTFTFKKFYLRRIRRILPALLVVIFTTLILAAFVLLPDDFTVMSKHIIATLLMMPNIRMWRASGDYFSPTVDSNPLLHLWSLGVEEQFYLFFPLALFLVLRYVKHQWRQIFLYTVTLLVFTSFAVWAAFAKPAFAFYWLPPRAWELLCGAFLAYFHYKTLTANLDRFQHVLAFIGLACILIAIVLPKDAAVYSVFLHQVLAVVGTVLLIQGNRLGNTLVFHLLIWKPLVGIGLISYSLYLWHWPLLSFPHYWLSPYILPWYGTALLMMVAFLLAYVTWRYVEMPFRHQALYSNSSVIKLVFSAQLVLLLCVVGIWYGNGIPRRFNNLSNIYLSGAEDVNPLQKQCHGDPQSNDSPLSINQCVFGGGAAEALLDPQFVVWGDSHANSITPIFKELAHEYSLAGLQTSLSSSPALLDVSLGDVKLLRNKNWHEYNQNTLKLLNDLSIKDVFLVGRWIYDVYGHTKFERECQGGLDSDLQSSTTTDPRLAFEYGLEKAVATLVAKNKRIWLVLPVPEMDRTVPRWLTFHNAGKTEVWVDNPYPERAASLRLFFERLSQQYGVHLLDPLPHLCRADGKCRIAHEGKAVYVDNNHLSASGSLLLADMLRPAFEIMKQDK